MFLNRNFGQNRPKTVLNPNPITLHLVPPHQPRSCTPPSHQPTHATYLTPKLTTPHHPSFFFPPDCPSFLPSNTPFFLSLPNFHRSTAPKLTTPPHQPRSCTPPLHQPRRYLTDPHTPSPLHASPPPSIIFYSPLSLLLSSFAFKLNFRCF